MQTVQNCEVMKKTEQFKVCKLYNSFKNVSITYLGLGKMIFLYFGIFGFFLNFHEEIDSHAMSFCTLI